LLSNAERGPERVQSKYFSNAGSWSPTIVTVSPVLQNVQKKKNIQHATNFLLVGSLSAHETGSS